MLDGTLNSVAKIFMLMSGCSPLKLYFLIRIGIIDLCFGALDVCAQDTGLATVQADGLEILYLGLDGDFGGARDDLLCKVDGKIDLL